MATSSRAAAAALERLDAITRRLRRECPWDREQDERTIVPHTVEEAYELADAAHAGDDGKLLDELGDVLFQVVFLSLLLEERGAGDLAGVAEHCRRKLIRRHPHVFADVEVSGSDEVLRNWDEIKRGEEGRSGDPFADVPEALPATLYARKVLRRFASTVADDRPRDADAAIERLEEEVGRLRAHRDTRDQRFDGIGGVLWEAVAVAGELEVDPELALRETARRLRGSVEDERSR